MKALYFYSFDTTTSGNLLLKGVYDIKYYDTENFIGCVKFTQHEIENAKGNFLVDRNRVVKNGKTWINNKSAQKRIKKFTFVKVL